jgi:predicted dehydrogenase
VSPGPAGGIGIIGCGNIAPVYLRTLSELDWVELVGFADGAPGRAEKFAADHLGLVGPARAGRAMSVDEMLLDPSIGAVVNLTPAHAHAMVSRRVLEAGKAVFSEKPLAETFGEGRALVDLAGSAGLRLGCAPDTFLGAGLQTARDAIDRGMIGEPISANAFMLGFGPEWWHPNPEIFYGPGAGPLFDMGPYYLTALNQLLGPTASVYGSARIGMKDRVIHAKGRVGDVVEATVPTHVSSIIEYVSGATATLVTSFDVKASRFRNIEIYGSEATLAVPDPNTFGGPVQIRSIINSDWRDVPLKKASVPQQRGIGLADMLSATSAGRPHRASAEGALHVLEQMSGIVRSSDEGRRLDITSPFTRPPLLAGGLAANRFD